MSYRLLIVEDSPELLEAMSDFFREEDAGLWEVVTASDGKDALAKVTGEDFDLLILDIMLPGASGFEICKAAARSYSRRPWVPKTTYYKDMRPAATITS